MTTSPEIPRILREETISIPAHLNGPPTSGHGGYTSAMAAAPLRGAVAVDLRRPIPLDRPLARRLLEGGRAELRDGDALIAEARETTLELQVPLAPGWEESVQASARYAGFRYHPFDMCFGCGPRRAVGDGLRIFPGPRAQDDQLAAHWVPHESLGTNGRRLPQEMIWAALDCSAGWASDSFARNNFTVGMHAVTAQLAVRIDGPVHAGQRYTILSWPLRAEGRKVHTGAVLYDEHGVAVALATALMVIIVPKN